MTIFEFDVKKGIYHFKFDDLNTETHSHPVVEIINTTKGTFSLEINNKKIDQLNFAIIDANVKHKIISDNCTTQILMVESHNTILNDFLINHDLRWCASP